MTTPLNNLTDTWNNGATVFTGLKYNITNTASASTSKPFDWQIGGQSFFRSNTDGSVFVDQQFGGLTGIPFTVAYQGTNAFTVSYQGQISALGTAAAFALPNVSSTINKITWGGLTEIYSPSAGILEFRQSTVAGTLRVYNTFTDSSNYERGVFDWTTTSNKLTIGVQVLGTGTLRALRIICGTSSFLEGGGSIWGFGDGTNFRFSIDAVNGAAHCPSGGRFTFSSTTTDPHANIDTGISRSAAGVLALGNGTAGDGSATILAKTKGGAFTNSDVAAGTWALCRDTSGATTKLIYNNAGTLMTVALT